MDAFDSDSDTNNGSASSYASSSEGGESVYSSSAEGDTLEAGSADLESPDLSSSSDDELLHNTKPFAASTVLPPRGLTSPCPIVTPAASAPHTGSPSTTAPPALSSDLAAYERPTRNRAAFQTYQAPPSDFFETNSSDGDDEDDEDFDIAPSPHRAYSFEDDDDESMDDLDDEDFEVARAPKRNTRRGRPAAPPTRRRRRVTDGSDSDFEMDGDEEFVRRSERSREAICYADEESSEEADKPVAPKAPVELVGDVIEKVLDKRETVEVGEGGEQRVKVEYLVKWKDWAHLHNTWDTEAYLADFNGFKRVYYFEKQAARDAELAAGGDTEDLEQVNIAKELEKKRMKEWTKVERIVASREKLSDKGEPETQYFVKWRGLGYDQNTWEAPKDIAKFQDKIDGFLVREQRSYSKRNTAWRRQRPHIPELQQQPAWLSQAGTLREYQLAGLNWLIQCWSSNINSILADEMGLGKTIQTVSFLSWLQFAQDIPGPFLVVVPLSTVDNWVKEFHKWAPLMNVVLYLGNSTGRSILREHEFGSDPATMKVNAVVTTFEILLKDKAILEQYRWVYLAVDEAHRLKNSDSQLHEVLSGFNTDNRLLITGTPLQNSLRELWSLLTFLHPRKFPSLADFEYRYVGLDTEESQNKIKDLHREIAPHLLRRYKKQVEKSLPSKTERILRVALSPMQKLYYKLILSRNVEQLNKSLRGEGKKASLVNIVVELRKCCNHPYLFQGAEDLRLAPSRQQVAERLIKNSGKLILLHKLLVRLKETGHRVLIFSQMVRMLDILSDYLAAQRFMFQRLDGSMSHDMRRSAMENFNAPDSKDFCFLLSTRAGGLGINLSTADTVIIYDSDWNPQNDLQAVARAHRIGQKNVVNFYRLVSQHTVEEEILERAKKKMVLDHLVIQGMDTTKKVAADAFSRDDFASILKFGSKALFQDDKPSAGADPEAMGEAAGDMDLDLDLDEILSRAEETEDLESGPLSAAEELLSSFRVSNVRSTYEEPTVPEAAARPEDDPEYWNRLLPDAVAVQESEMVLGPRKRTVTSYAEYGAKKEDAAVEDEGADTGKRRRGKASGRKDASKRQRMGTDSSPLVEKEVRALLKSLRKFASRDRLEEVLEDCKLAHKTKAMMKVIVDEVFEMAEAATDNYIEYHSVSLNVAELVRRMEDLAYVGKKIEAYEDPAAFRINVKIKPAQFPGCSWTPKDDSMLLWGAYHYGIGNWSKVRMDPAIPLATTLPNGEQGVKDSQLTRRVEALLRGLREEREALKSGGEKKTKVAKSKRKTARAPPKSQRKERDRQRKEEPEARSGRRKSDASESESGSAVFAEDPLLMGKAKRIMSSSRQVMKDLCDLSNKKLSKGARIAETKRCLITLGETIEDSVRETRRGKDELRRHLWHYVAEKTATQTGDHLYGLYQRLRTQLD